MVSVVIPDCRYGAYLERCINSIKRQTYRDIEIIAISENEIEEETMEGIKWVTAHDGVKDILYAALDNARGQYLIFISYNCVPAPNLVEELVRAEEASTESFFAANEVMILDDTGKLENNSILAFVGKILRKELLKMAIVESTVSTYSDELVILDNYRKRCASQTRYVDSYYYITGADKCEKKSMKYDMDCYKNTLKLLLDFDEIERSKIEKVLIEDVLVPDNKRDEVCNIVCELAHDSFRLMVDCVISYYEPLYKLSCRKLDGVAYERVKKFLMGIENPDLLDIVLKKLSMSYEMFSAMKRLDVHNYIFVIQDNSLFIANQYPDGIYSIYGTELAEYVTARYLAGDLGLGSIIKSIYGWLKYKIHLMKGS